jgi:hypothetical protein
MKLPNISKALIERAKITEYLLSDENSDGKAAFFFAFGFKLELWTLLKDALLEHARQHEVIEVSETRHGIKYRIEGELTTPAGRTVAVRAIWIVDTGNDYPRLVTAYPL